MNSQNRNIAKSKTVALKKIVIGYWLFDIGHMEQCNNLFEWFPNNSFPMPKCPLLNQLYTILCIENPIERFHSRGQHLCKFMWTKEIVCVSKQFNSHKICLKHQHGRRDVMWKRSILYWRGIFRNSNTYTLLSENHTRFWDKRAQVLFPTLGWNSWIFFINQVFRA